MTAAPVCCKNQFEHCRCDDSRGAPSGLPIEKESRILLFEESPRVIEFFEGDPEPEPPSAEKPKPLRRGFLNQKEGFEPRRSREEEVKKSPPSPRKKSPPPREQSPPAHSPPPPHLLSSPESPVSSKRKKVSVKPSTSKESDKVKSEAKNDELTNANPTSDAVPEEVRDIVELPPPVKCRVCSTDIQPTHEVFYHWTCADQCDFNLHKTCLHEEMGKQGFKKKREMKDASCVTEGCSAPIAAVFEIDMNNKESLYIKSESDKGDKQEHKKFDKLKHSLAKDLRKSNKKETILAKKFKHEKGDHVDNGDSGTSSARPSATPEEPAEHEVPYQRPEPRVVLPAEPAISLAKPISVSGGGDTPVVERKMKPMMVEVNSKAVPLQKKTDEVESKYAVAEQKPKEKTKNKVKNKPKGIDVYIRPAHPQIGGFDESPTVGFSPLSNFSNRVPENWDEERSEFSDSRPSSSGHAEPASFGSGHSLPPELSQFPDNINGTVTFPLPGTAQSKVYMKNIIEAVSGCLEDLVLNTSEGTNAPISGLLDALIFIAGDRLEPSQKEFLKKLFTGDEVPSLREFISGLKYFMISLCLGKLTFGKNKAGRELYESISNPFAMRDSPAEPFRQESLPPVPPPPSDPIPPSTNSELLNQSYQSLDVQMSEVSQDWDDEEYFDVGEPAYDYEELQEQQKRQELELIEQRQKEELIEQRQKEELIEQRQEQELIEQRQEEQQIQEATYVENSRSAATTPSDSAKLVDQMTNFVLNSGCEEKFQEPERTFSEFDKKIQLKVNALNLKAELQKEKNVEMNRRMDEDTWRYEVSDEKEMKEDKGNWEEKGEGLWGRKTTTDSKECNNGESNGACRSSSYNQPSNNHPIYSRPGLFSQRHRYAEEPPAPKMVPQEEFNNTCEKYKKELSEMEDKMKEQAKLVKKLEREMVESTKTSEQYRRNNELLNGVVNDQEKRLRDLETRFRDEKLLRDQGELRVKRLELQHRQLEVEKELFWVESSIYHNKKIIMALMQCHGTEFEDMVEELSENHNQWIEIEDAVRHKKELLQRGETKNLPELPPIPPLSERVMHYFQLAVEYSTHPYNALIHQHFPHLKSQLVFYAEIACQELPHNDTLKEMLLRELQTQEQSEFDIALATRRIASELGLPTYSDSTEYSAPSPPVPAVEPQPPSPVPPSPTPPTLPAPIGRKPRAPAAKAPSSSNASRVWKPTSSNSDRNVDLVERDCEICMEPMRANERTHDCKRCKEPYHSKCVLPWLELQGTCPHCRATMPHPEQFPELC